MEFEYSDASQQWFEAIMTTDLVEARSRAFSLIAEGTKTDAGCIETPTLDARKVRFHGRQMAAYPRRAFSTYLVILNFLLP